MGHMRESISPRQLFLLVLFLQNGFQLFRKPWGAGIENIILIGCGACLSQLLLLGLWKLLSSDGMSDGVFPWIVQRCGKPLAAVVLVIIAMFAIGAALSELLYLADLIRIWILPATATLFVLVLLVCVSAYAGSSRLGAVMNILQVGVIPLCIGLFIIALQIGEKWDIEMLLPVWDRYNENKSAVEGIVRSFASFASVEMLLIVFPLVGKGKAKQGLYAVSLANALSVLIYTAVTVVASIQFTSPQMKAVPIPLLYALKQMEGGAVQSVDILFLCFWIFVYSIRIILYLYLAGSALRHLPGLARRQQGLFVWGAGACCIAAAPWIQDHYLVIALLETKTLGSVIFVASMAVLIWLLSMAKSNKGRAA